MGLGLFRFLWITLGSPHSQRWVSLIFIVTREAVPARRGRCLVRCLCSREAFAESCERSSGTIYLRGNLGEAACTRKATNLRNQVQLRSCHLRTVSQKAVPHEVLIFSYDSAFHTVSIVGLASGSVRGCIFLVRPSL